MKNQERNKIVNEYIQKIRAGDEKAKVDLYQKYILPFFEAFFINLKNSGLSAADRNLLPDLKQDLWFMYDRSLSNWNDRAPFISYMVYAFRSTLAKMNWYTTGLSIYYSDQIKQYKQIELTPDMFEADTSNQDDTDDIAYILSQHLDKLTPLQRLVVELYWHIKPIPDSKITKYVTAKEVATYLFNNHKTKKVLTGTRISQILDEAYEAMGADKKTMIRGRLLSHLEYTRIRNIDKRTPKKYL